MKILNRSTEKNEVIMKQLDLFSSIDNNIMQLPLEEDNSLKIVEVEVTKTYDNKAILIFIDR